MIPIGYKPEKLDSSRYSSCIAVNREGKRPGRSGDSRWYIKKMTTRWRRRKAARLMEDAPPDNRYRGWWY